MTTICLQVRVVVLSHAGLEDALENLDEDETNGVFALLHTTALAALCDAFGEIELDLEHLSPAAPPALDRARGASDI